MDVTIVNGQFRLFKEVHQEQAQVEWGESGTILEGINEGSGRHALEELVEEEVLDGEGMLMLPPYVESHIHLDTVLTAGDPEWNESGTLFEGIKVWGRRKQLLTREDVLRRATAVLHSLVGQGVLHVRTHADISEPSMTALRTLLELKESMAGLVDLQVIAFPQDGLIACPDNRARLREALRLGADGISAIPHGEPSREAGIASLDDVFALAADTGCQLHLFCDELDDAHSRYLEAAAERTSRFGLGPRVTAAHVNATAYYGEAYFRKLAGQVAAAGMNIVCCPLINSAMQGRFDSFPKGRGIARIAELTAAGVNVAVAHDDIATPFYPLGSGSMLTAAHMAVHLAHMTGLSELEQAVAMITTNAAQALGITHQYGLAPGKPASFVLVDADDPRDLLRRQPPCRYVVRQGQLIARTEPARTSLLRQGQLSEADLSLRRL